LFALYAPGYWLSAQFGAIRCGGRIGSKNAMLVDCPLLSLKEAIEAQYDLLLSGRQYLCPLTFWAKIVNFIYRDMLVIQNDNKASALLI